MEMQQEKISKKHRDIDSTLEEIKNNLNNLSQKIKSKDIKNIYKNSSENKIMTKKSGIESSESDGEIDYLSKKYKENEFDLKKENISKIKLGAENNIEFNKYMTHNTNRSYSSGDSVNAEDYSKILFERKLRSDNKDFSKNLNANKSRFNDSNILNALSSYKKKYNPSEHYKSNNKFSTLNNPSINDKFANKHLEDSLGHKIKSSCKNKPESNWSSEKKYYKKKKFLNGNMLLNSNKDDEPHNKNFVNNLNNSISLLKERNIKYKNYNNYKTYEEYQITQGDEEKKNLKLNKNKSNHFNKSSNKLEELKEKNDIIEKELDTIHKNFKEIKGMRKDKKPDKLNELHINDKNSNLMYQSMQPKEYAKIKRKNKPLNDKSHDLSLSDSNNKNKNYQTQHYFISESDDETNRKKKKYSNNQEVFSADSALIEKETYNKKSESPLQNQKNKEVDILGSAADKESNNKNVLKNKRKENENYKFYYVKKNIQNVSNNKNRSKDYDNVKIESMANKYYVNSTNIKNRNKDLSKGGKIVSIKSNRTEKQKEIDYNNTLNFSKLNKSKERFENLNATKAFKDSPNQNKIKTNYIIDNNHELKQSTKMISIMEKNIENYEEKITSYKNLLNEYMPEDIGPESFTIINSYLNGKDRWFLVKRNHLKDQANNLFWVRESELINLGFNINFNLFKNDNFDFCLIANNMHKLREDSKRFIGEIEDLKSFLNQELEKKEIILEDKINEIAKVKQISLF